MDIAERQQEEISQLLCEVRNLCMVIVGSSPETKIKGEIESLAFGLAHHPLILNADQP